MIRGVRDANIIVSATIQPLGPPANIVRLVAQKRIQLCVSSSVYAEYKEVLGRPELRRAEARASVALATVRATACWVLPITSANGCSDPDDNIFLECAQAASAAYLITGNAADYPARWLDTLIVTPRQFLERLQST